MKKRKFSQRLWSILLCLAMVLTIAPCIAPSASAASSGSQVEGGSYITAPVQTNESLFEATRTDFRDESVYTLIITRFNDGDNGNNVHCWDDAQAGNPDSDPAWRGDFKGLVEKLDYIKALGFTAVRLNPVAQNASGYDYHGYHPVDLMSIDYRLESDGYTYQDLIDACHAKGLKVMQEVVLNNTSNFGEAYLRKMFEIDKNAGWASIAASMIPTEVLLDAYPDYASLTAGAQFQARMDVLRAHVTPSLNADEHYHRETSMVYESSVEQQGSIAGDCIDINTENPEVAVYLAQTCKMYAQMGVDAILIQDARYINRWTLNSGILPALREMLEKDGQDIEIFYYVEARVRETWNRNIPSCSVPFYSWAETESEWIGNWDTTSPTANIQKSIDHYNAHTDPSGAPTSTNALLNGITYHTPDYSNASGMNAYDFTMMWNFENANNAYRAALAGDQYMNDATWNLMSVDTIDYGPDGMSHTRYSVGTQAWAENLNLMFTFRGIPSILYGTEAEFAKNLPLDMGPNVPLAETGRAYYGDYMGGNVETNGFLDYSASGTVADTLNSPLAIHIRQLNAIRMKVPALRKGQYTNDSNYVSGNMAFIRRYTNAAEGIDSLALVAITNGATFKNIPNGKYVDAVSGDVKNVTNGTLTAAVSGMGNLAVYVCCADGFTGLDAEISVEKFVLDFDLNGVEGTMASIEANAEGYVVLPAFDGQTPEGMELKAWEINGKQYQVGDAVKLTENTTAKAIWEKPAVYELWVNGTQVTTINAGNILTNGKASYDAVTGTLTLNSGSFENITSGLPSLTVNIPQGTVSTITGGSYGIYTESGDVKLTGGGTLLVCGTDSGIRAGGTVTVSGTTVNVLGESGSAIAGSSIVFCDASVTAVSHQGAVLAAAPDCSGFTGEYTLKASRNVNGSEAGEYSAEDHGDYRYAAIRPSYTVTFDAGEGSGTMAGFCSDGTLILPESTFTGPEGADFAGWKNGDEVKKAGAVDLISADTVYTALWGAESADSGEDSGSLTTIYFTSSSDWSTVNAYCWSNSGGNMATWPGTGMEKIDGTDVWKIDVDTSLYQKIIFNNGASQTGDLDIPTDGSNLYTLSTNSWSTYSAGTVSYSKEQIVRFVPGRGAGAMPAAATEEDSIVLPTCAFIAPLDGTFRAWKIGETEYQPGSTVQISGDTLVTAVWNAPFGISCTSMTMGNSLAMNFAFRKDCVSDWTGYYVEITKTYADGRANVVERVPYGNWQTAGGCEGDYYYVTFNGIAAKEMTDDINVVIYNAEGEDVGGVYTDSVAAQSARILAKSNTSDEEKTMIVDMLNYGAAAQEYFGYGTDHLANAGLTEEQAAYASAPKTCMDSRGMGTNYVATNVVLKSNIQMMFAFRNIDTTMTAKVTFTNHRGVAKEVTISGSDFIKNGSCYVVTVEDLVVADGRQDVTCVIYDANGNEVANVTDSLESYTARKNGAEEIFIKMMQYSDSAYDYFH